ncbi:MAG: zf-HC2 domain-containing protein [Candidatus Aminicenantes bacterium]|nr:zf-HC2 domain-containing protein [Candidatus Aminicenantes bacterium]
MNKKCREIESLLSAYLENELPKEELENISDHLNGCSACLGKKEKMEEILLKLSELQEEVPFFLKNRLLNIPDLIEKTKPLKSLFFPKWLAAAVGTIILFLNLFYFTNIFPPVNREVHSVVSSIEKFIVKTGGWFEKIKESKELLFFTFFNKKSIEIKENKVIQNNTSEKDLVKGGKNG